MPEHRITGDEIHFLRSDGSSLNKELHGDNIDFITEAPIKVHNAIIPDRLNTDDIRNSNNQQLIEYSSDKINIKKPINFGNNLVEIDNISLEASQINKSTNSPGYTNLAGELAVLHQGVSDNSNQVFNLGSSNIGKIIVVGNPSTDVEVGSINESNILTTIANKTITGTLTMGSLTAGKALQLDSNKNIIAADIINDFADLTGGAAIGQIPDLPASKITSGSLADDRIPNLNASKITSGTIADARLPTNIVRTDTNNQSINSSITINGGTGDAILTLKADSDNSNESDNAFIQLLQDGGTDGASNGTRATLGLNSDNDLFLGIPSSSNFYAGMLFQTHGSGTGSNQKPIIFRPQQSETCRITQFGISLTPGKTYMIGGQQIDFGDIANTGNIDSARLNTEINPTIIPNLDSAKISTGTLGVDRIPTLTIGKIPPLTADKIASGELGVDRIPTLTTAKIPDLAASKITSGELGVDRIPTLTTAKIPSLAASKITSGTFSTARIPSLSASKIGSGTLSIDRIPTITDAKLPTNILRDDVASQTISNTTANTELNVKVRSDVSTYNPVIKLSKHNNSDVLQEQLTMTLTDTAVESNTDTAYIYKVGTQEKLRVSGSSVKISDTLNINDKIQLQGSNPGANSVIQVGTDGTASFVASSTLAATTSASDLTSGTLDNARLSLDANTIPNLSANKITSDVLDIARIPNLSANKITSDVLDIARIPTLNFSNIANSGNIDSARLNTEIHIDRIPQLTEAKLPDDITVNRIKFNDTIGTDAGNDSLTSPSIHDYADSLVFDVNAGKRYSYKVGNVEVFEIDGTGIDNVKNCDLASGGVYSINGTQIGFSDIANTGNIDSARLNTEIPIGRLPTLNFDNIANSGSIDSERLNTTIHIDRIPTITDTKLPTNIIRNNVDNQEIACNTFTLSSGTSGDCALVIKADTDNSNDNDNPKISFLQDGVTSGELAAIGLQAGDNAMYLKTNSASRPIIFQQASNEELRIKNNGISIPTGNNYQINNQQITTAALSDNASIVKTSGTQTIGGAKTFTGALSFAGSLHSAYSSGNATGIILSNGRTSVATGHQRQISMGFNGTTNYQHHIATNHDSSTITNNKIEFFCSDGTAAANTLPTTAVRRAFSLFPTSDGGSTAKVYGKSECDSIETMVGQAKFKQPYVADDFAVECANIHIRNDMGFNSGTSSGLLQIDGYINYKGYFGAGQWYRMMAGMRLGEDFMDDSKVLKMQVSMYRLSTVTSSPEKYIRVETVGGGTTALMGYGESAPGDANTTNPSTITVNHSNSNDTFGTSFNNAAVHKINYGGSSTPFSNSNSGVNTVVCGTGYLFKKATGTNPFDGVTKLGTRTLWQVGSRCDDDFRLSVNGELIQTYFYGSGGLTTVYKYSVFEMVGDWAFIEYRNMNGSGNAYVNLVFQCLAVI